MPNEDTVKMSILLPQELHQKLKLLAIERGTTLQEMMYGCVLSILGRNGNSAEKQPRRRLTTMEIARRKRALGRILASGDETAIRCCTAIIEAMGTLTAK